MHHHVWGLFLGVLVLSISCSSSDSSPISSKSEVVVAPDEDELLLRLSSFLLADTGQVAREQNIIVDYAIEHMLNLEMTPSGLFYEVIEHGQGDSIAWGDFLHAHYKGYLLDGTVFANSKKSQQVLAFYVGNMVEGWNEGLQLVTVGAKLRLFVPSRLGYGNEGLKSSKGRVIVAPNEVLAFELEVLKKEIKE